MNIFKLLKNKQDKNNPIFKHTDETSVDKENNTSKHLDIDMLVCKENNTLTVMRTTYKHDDMYFIKDRKLLSIIDEIYDRHNILVDKSLEHCNHAIRPDCYFDIADLLNLNVDKLSFIYIVCMWCDNNECWNHDSSESLSPTEFRKVRPDCFPKTLPEGWENIYNEADEFYQRVFEEQN